MRVLEPTYFQPAKISAALVQILTLAAVATTPWWYGSATWEAQDYLFLFGVALSVVLGVHGIVALGDRDARVLPPVLSWILFGLGGFAFLQAVPVTSWTSTSLLAPSMELQRWSMGMDPAQGAGAIDAAAGAAGVDGVATSLCDLPLGEMESRRMAVSVEPNTTRAASASFFLCGLLVWAGCSVFSQRRSFPVLLATIAGIAAAIAILGMVGSLSQNRSYWTGLAGQTSFATFVSKNSAGAYINVGIAAALGWTAWAIIRVSSAKNSSRRHKLPWKQRVLHDVRVALGSLDAVQIAGLMAVVFLISALLLSMSRGATLAGLAALVVAMGVGVTGKRPGLSLAVTLIVLGLSVTLLVGLQMDEEVVQRLESIGDIDWESEARGGRFYIWGVSWEAAKSYGWLGSGLGTFHLAALPFQKQFIDSWYYHAESVYAEAMVTVGYLGLIVCVLAVGFSFQWLRGYYISERFRDFLPLQIAGIYVLISQAAHSAVDFAIILPGVYVPASLLLGGAIGGAAESQRIAQKVKLRRQGLQSQLAETQKTKSTSSISSVSYLVCPISMSILGMLLLHETRRSVHELAVAERIEAVWRSDDDLPLEQRMESRLDDLAERAARSAVVPPRSPQLLRLLADAIVYDGRRAVWRMRPESSLPEPFWREISPTMVRLTLDRVEESKREQAIEIFGGGDRLLGMTKAHQYYLQSQLLSPLDWRSLWGRLTTAWQCSPQELKPLAAAVQRNFKHVSQSMLSATILFQEVWSDEERLEIWRGTIQGNPGNALVVARLMGEYFSDERIAMATEIFPSHPNLLHRIARDLLPRERFPLTYEKLMDRAIDIAIAAPVSRDKLVRQASDIVDMARETGKSELEIQWLIKYLEMVPKDLARWQRLNVALVDAGNGDEARKQLANCQAKNPDIPDAQVKAMKKRIEALESASKAVEMK